MTCETEASRIDPTARLCHVTAMQPPTPEASTAVDGRHDPINVRIGGEDQIMDQAKTGADGRSRADGPRGADRDGELTEKLDPGAYIGSQPEREEESIPGGVRPGDERIAAHSTQVGPRREQAPTGHREGSTADDDRVREAGQDR